MTAKMSRRKLLRVGLISTVGAGALASVVGSQLAFGQSAAPSSLTIYIFRGEEGIKGPDGQGHDSFVPSSFVLQAGVATTLNIVNMDESAHSINAPDLGLAIPISPGNVVGGAVQPVTTSATVTVPQAGVYRWYCSLDCDAGGGQWAMTDGFDGKGQDGFMAGNIVVV
jgi:plastocyanin